MYGEFKDVKTSNDNIPLSFARNLWHDGVRIAEILERARVSLGFNKNELSLDSPE